MKDIWAVEGKLIDSLIGDPCPKLPKETVLSKIRWVTLGKNVALSNLTCLTYYSLFLPGYIYLLLTIQGISMTGH